jgi:hypothetical protein
VRALELFSGCARMSRALARAGVDTEAWDIADDAALDLTRPDIRRRIYHRLRSGRVVFVWLGTPCTSFSAARKHDGLGPAPLRDDDHPAGLPNLSRSDQEKVNLGNRLLDVSINIMQTCVDLKIPCILENPASSRLWLMPKLRAFISRNGAGVDEVHYCQYGTEWKKPTKLLSWGLHSLKSILKLCSGRNGQCSQTGLPHRQLTGRDATGTFWTLRAQPYPMTFCQDLAQHIVANVLIQNT